WRLGSPLRWSRCPNSRDVAAHERQRRECCLPCATRSRIRRPARARRCGGEAQAAVERLDPEWFRVRASMVQTLRGDDTSAALRTVYDVQEMGAAAAPATIAFMALLTHPEDTLRAAAATALDLIGPRAAEAVSLLTDFAAAFDIGTDAAPQESTGPEAATAVPESVEAGEAAPALPDALAAVLRDHASRVNAVAVSPDGLYVTA